MKFIKFQINNYKAIGDMEFANIKLEIAVLVGLGKTLANHFAF